MQFLTIRIIVAATAPCGASQLFLLFQFLSSISFRFLSIISFQFQFPFPRQFIHFPAFSSDFLWRFGNNPYLCNGFGNQEADAC